MDVSALPHALAALLLGKDPSTVSIEWGGTSGWSQTRFGYVDNAPEGNRTTTPRSTSP